MKQIKMLRARHWAWVAVLAIAGIWWPLFILMTPPVFIQETANALILNFCMGVALVGAIIKIVGYIMSQMPAKVGVLGISIEVVGLVLAVVGPGSYIIVSIFGFIDPNIELAFGSAFIFAWALIAVYAYRAIIIVPRFLFEAHDSTKDDS